LHDFLRRGWLETYQSYQTSPAFDGVDTLVVFIGVGGTRARLVGILQRDPAGAVFGQGHTTAGHAEGCDLWRILLPTYATGRL
jgi:hypothetical protein